MIKEFREFITRGNVIDLAVGIIIGAAFTAIVSSLVTDIITPPIGYLLSGVDFSNIAIVLGENPQGELVTINIGAFLNALIQFLVTAFAVFMLVRVINRLNRQKKVEEAVEEATAPPTAEEKLTIAVDRLTTVLERMDNRP